MKLKHTPGPWKTELNNAVEIGIHTDNVSFIAQINGSHRRIQIRANARLIAAAPEMLEALIQIIKKYIYDGKESRANLFIPLIEKATGLPIDEVLSDD